MCAISPSFSFPPSSFPPYHPLDPPQTHFYFLSLSLSVREGGFNDPSPCESCVKGLEAEAAAGCMARHVRTEGREKRTAGEKREEEEEKTILAWQVSSSLEGRGLKQLPLFLPFKTALVKLGTISFFLPLPPFELLAACCRQCVISSFFPPVPGRPACPQEKGESR